MNPLKQSLDRMYAQLAAMSSRDLAKMFKLPQGATNPMRASLISVSQALTNLLNLVAAASRTAESTGTKQSSNVNDNMTKTAACPQCGNEEFGPGLVCEDCGYPHVKSEREPAAKAKIVKPEAEPEYEWPYLEQLAKFRAGGQDKEKDIRVYPSDAHTEEGKNAILSEGGVIWWCEKCDTLASSNRPCDCESNVFGKESPEQVTTEEEIQQRLSFVRLMSELVKIADQLDKEELYEYASEIDSVLFKSN